MSKAWLFPGQGAQFVGMAQDLAVAYPEVRDTLQEADDALGFSLRALMAEGPMETLTLTANTQPAVLAHSVAVLRLLRAGGIEEPVAVVGHSLGEYSALVAAGAIDFADALRTVQARGRFMQEAVPAGVGAMAAIIGLPGDRVAAVCAQLSRPDALVCAANFNDTKQTVIAGHSAAVEAALPVLKEAGARRALPLPVSAPFHCPLMAPVQPRLAEVLSGVRLSDPVLPVVANVDAAANRDGRRVSQLLIEQVTAPVRFVDCVGTLASMGVSEALEIGPGRALAGMVKRIAPEIAVISVGTEEQVKTLLG
jgi:[acyl-carrier-protein] S-malonyltransferase